MYRQCVIYILFPSVTDTILYFPSITMWGPQEINLQPLGDPDPQLENQWSMYWKKRTFTLFTPGAQINCNFKILSLALGQNFHCFQWVRYWSLKTSHRSAFYTLYLTLWLPYGLTAAAMTLQSDHMPVFCLSGGRLMGDSCSRPQEAALCRCDSFVTAVSITTRTTEKKDILSEN